MYLEQPGQTPQLIAYPAPEPDPERPVLFEEVKVSAQVSAQIVVRRAKEPLSQGFSRATRRGGLLICSGRAAHETTLAGCEGRPGARHLYGEVRCEAIERLQRAALERPRPELVVRVDRSGLNEHHPLVAALYAAIDRTLKPIVVAEPPSRSSIAGCPKSAPSTPPNTPPPCTIRLKRCATAPTTRHPHSSPLERQPTATPGRRQRPAVTSQGRRRTVPPAEASTPTA